MFRSNLYKKVYQNPQFEFVDDGDQGKASKKMIRASTSVVASVIINDTQKLYRSPFWAAMLKENRHWKQPTVSPLSRLVKNLDGKVLQVKYMLTWTPYLRFRIFMVPDAVTKVLVPEQWV